MSASKVNLSSSQASKHGISVHLSAFNDRLDSNQLVGGLGSELGVGGSKHFDPAKLDES